MGILDNLAGMFDGNEGANTGVATEGGLSGILKSGVLGPLAQSVLGNKQGNFSWLKGALMAGAGAMLWKKLSERVGQANASNPQYSAAPAAPEEQAARIIRALVFAAKADGHIDAAEQAAINAQIKTLNIGRDGEALVRQAMNEPLDPNLVASGVKSPEEALRLYALSRAAINPDQFMEKNYLDALAQALNIPADVRRRIEEQIASS